MCGDELASSPNAGLVGSDGSGGSDVGNADADDLLLEVEDDCGGGGGGGGASGPGGNSVGSDVSEGGGGRTPSRLCRLWRRRHTL